MVVGAETRCKCLWGSERLVAPTPLNPEPHFLLLREGHGPKRPPFTLSQPESSFLDPVADTRLVRDVGEALDVFSSLG